MFYEKKLIIVETKLFRYLFDNLSNNGSFKNGEDMWIEVCGKLINFNHVTKVEKNVKLFELYFYTDHDKIDIKFNDELELEQVYFNLLERIKSKPIDGFRK